jgi:anti-sigma regulatory factor (Ser/Thr protein kinase)
MNIESMVNNTEKQINEQFIGNLEFGKTYPEPVDISKIYKENIDLINNEKDYKEKNKLIEEFANVLYQKNFTDLEKNKSVFYNVIMPKDNSKIIIRYLLEKVAKPLNLTKDILEDLKYATAEAATNYWEHEQGKDGFPLKMLISKNKMQVLFGDDKLNNIVPETEYNKKDLESDSGRGLNIMSILLDKFETRCNQERSSYAYFMEKNFN